MMETPHPEKPSEAIDRTAPRRDSCATGPGADAIDVKRLRARARAASGFLKALSNQHRLMILCHLIESEQSVGELEERLGIQQAHLSQQLARLRRDGLVRTRRESRLIYYSLGSEEAREMIATLYRLFCSDRPAKRRA